MNQEAFSAVAIDELNLDKECIRLPGDYLKWAVRSAELKRDADAAKGRMELLEAKLSAAIRDTPNKFKVEKATVDAVKGAVQKHSRFQAATEEYNEAKHQQELAQAVVWALEHKKRSLTLLVNLHGMGYFSDVKMSAEGQEAVQKMTKSHVRGKVKKTEEDWE